MNIIIMSGLFFPAPSGAAYSALRLAKSLRDRGVGISFVVNEQGQEWRNGGAYDGFPVQSFPLYQPGKIRKLQGLLRFTRYIWKRRHLFDVFHISGGGHVNIFLGWWVKIITARKVSLKITLDGWDTPDGVMKDKWGRLLSYCYRRLDGIVAMTSGQTAKCCKWGYAGRLATIPNGVDTQVYSVPTREERDKARAVLGLSSDEVSLIYVGCIEHRKGIDVLLRVWDRLRQKYERTRLLLVGDYTQDGDAGIPFLLSFALQHDINPSIVTSPGLIRIGRVENVEMYLQGADIFVFPSRQEGFGTVQVEAMACGLPCVVNDLAGVSCDIFPDETVGFRIHENCIDDYVRVISDLIDHPEKRDKIGRAARERAVSCFSTATVAERYISFYKALIHSPDS